MAVSTVPGDLRSTLGRPFGVHLSALGLANLADGVVQTGVGLLAISLTRSPLLVGALTAATWLPWLLLGMPAGVLVDRWDRRRTMAVALTVRAVLLAAAAALGLSGRLHIGWLLALALLYGVTEVFTDLAAAAQVPALVGTAPDRLRRANARLLGVEQVTNGFVGPPAAGLLVGLGAAWVLGLPVLAVVAAVVALTVGLSGSYRARTTQEDPTSPPGPAGPTGSIEPEQRPGSLLRTVVAGFGLVWRHPVLRPVLLAGGLYNLGSTAFGAVLLLWLVGPGSAGGLTPREWGLAAVAFPAGALLGSSLSGPVLRRWPEVRVMVVCWGASALLVLLPLAVPTFWGAVALGLGNGTVGVLGNVVSGSLRPRMVPADQLGRVGGAARVLGFGAMPLGALGGGQLGELYGLPAVIVAASVVTLGATVIVGLTVTQRLVDEHDLSRRASG